MPKNKVRYGLKNVHVAKAIFADDGSVSYAPPVAIPGAVSMSLSANGDMETFWADDIPYDVSSNNMGYEGDVEFAMLSQYFLTDILREEEDSNGVLVEQVDVDPVHFAFLFEFTGDKRRIRHVLYNCIANRPGLEGKTKADKKEIQTEKINISSVPLPNGIVKAKTGDNTDTTAYNGWYTSVYQVSSAASSARLSALSITGVSLSPSFAATEYNYTAETSDATNAVTATASDGASVVLLVNGSSHTSGESATWTTGTNTVVAIVSKSGLTSKTYTITVTKSGS